MRYHLSADGDSVPYLLPRAACLPIYRVSPPIPLPAKWRADRAKWCAAIPRSESAIDHLKARLAISLPQREKWLRQSKTHHSERATRGGGGGWMQPCNRLPHAEMTEALEANLVAEYDPTSTQQADVMSMKWGKKQQQWWNLMNEPKAACFLFSDLNLGLLY